MRVSTYVFTYKLAHTVIFVERNLANPLTFKLFTFVPFTKLCYLYNDKQNGRGLAKNNNEFRYRPIFNSTNFMDAEVKLST